MTVPALNAYLAPSVLLPRSICSPQMSATSPSSFAFLLNSLTVWPFALWLVFTYRPGWSLLHRLLRPRLTPASSKKSRSPRIRYDTFPLILAPCTPGCFGSSWALRSFASLPLTQCLFTKFLSIKSRFCVQLPSHVCSRLRSCLPLAVRRANVRRSLPLPSYRPCRAYIGIGGRDDRPPPTPPDMRVRIRRFGQV